MNPLENIAARHRTGGFNAREILRQEQDIAACYLCRKYHPLRGNNADHDYQDFACRHPAELGHVVLRLTPAQFRRIVHQAQRRRKLRHDSVLNFTHNQSVLEAFQGSDQSVDLTSFNSLANSATAGWSSHYVDNSVNLYLDLLAYISFAAVNTAPGSNKTYYLFGATALNTTDLPSTGAAASGTVANSSTTSAALTFPSISTPLPCVYPTIRIIPYPVQNAVITTPLFPFNRPFNGSLGLYNWYALINFTGMTIAAASNVFKYRGVYNTVA